MPRHFAASLTVSAALLGASAVLGAQTGAQTGAQPGTQLTGTSHPEDLSDSITTTSAAPHYSKPSPAVLAPTPTTAATTCVQPSAAVPTPTLQAAPTVQLAEVAERRSAPAVDPDSGIVEEVPAGPNEVPPGALLHTALSREITTAAPDHDTTFRTQLLQPYQHHGKVLLPAGSILSGRVAELHGGNRLHGGPVIHLVPDAITLPDGTRYRLSGQVVDLPQVHDAHVNDEGVIHGSTNVKGTASGVGLTTASATVAGAVIGGPVGAGVGAGIGAGVATVWWLKHDQEQTLPEGTEVVFSLEHSLFLEPSAR